MTPSMEALRALGMLAVIVLCITLSVYLCKGWRWLESEGARHRRAAHRHMLRRPVADTRNWSQEYMRSIRHEWKRRPHG